MYSAISTVQKLWLTAAKCTIHSAEARKQLQSIQTQILFYCWWYVTGDLLTLFYMIKSRLQISEGMCGFVFFNFAHSNEFGTIKTHWGEWTFWGRHDSSLTVAVWVVMAAEAQGWLSTIHLLETNGCACTEPSKPQRHPPILIINPLGDAWL